MRSYLFICWLCVASAACEPPTSFRGAAKFPDGVTGCRQSCTRDGLEFGGFVYSGEFATSCVCQPARPAAAAASSAESNPTAGVIVQTQAAAAAAAANNAQQLRMQQQLQEQEQQRRRQQEQQRPLGH